MKAVPELAVGQRYLVGADPWEVESLTSADPAYQIVLRQVQVSNAEKQGRGLYFDNNHMDRYGGNREQYVDELRAIEVEPQWFLRYDVREEKAKTQ